jgi:hypothetical protein
MRTTAAAIAIAAAACTPHDAPQDGAEQPVTTSSPKPTSASTATLEGYPWARLRVADNPVEPLALSLDSAALTRLGVRSHRSYMAPDPAVWLIAFEFRDQKALLDAENKVLALWPPEDPPYERKTSHTGAWLLVTGFPSSKPVSPEMERARTTFLSQWAGEE